MIRKLRIAIIATLLIAAPSLISAQVPPHPNGGIAPGSGNGPVGGGAPVDNGTIILLVFAAAYSGLKAKSLKKLT
jgi:hypothetical protein